MTQKYNLLMLNYEFPPIGGGAGKANLCLLKEFAGKDELSIDVLTSAPKPGMTVENFAENITIYKVGVHKKSLHFWRKIEVLEWLIKSRLCYRALVRKNKYDLVHAFFGFPTAYLCYKSAKVLPYIISLRGSDVPGYNVRLGLDYKILSPLFRRIWKNSSAILANSTGLAALASKFTPDLNIGVINNGVYTDTFFPKPEKKLTRPIKLLTVCRLISRKRIDMLIEAVAYTKKLGMTVQLNIAGHGNLLAELTRLTKELNVREQVNFMGRISAENMPQVYRDNDIFIMSSAHEGMSNAMLEAMATGLPIITTRCEGVEELIDDNGIVVEKDDAELIAAAIKELAGDTDRYTRTASAAKRQAGNFTWPKMAEEYLKCYRTVIEKCDA
jgi:glycosyltransferase involved in cell wall biosynthesis